jgi:hypothetical protein
MCRDERKKEIVRKEGRKGEWGWERGRKVCMRVGEGKDQ